MGIHYDAGAAMAQAEGIQASRQNREYQRWQMDAAKEDRGREGERRQRLGDYILSGQARHQDAPAMGDPNPSAGNTGTLRDLMHGGIGEAGAMPGNRQAGQPRLGDLAKMQAAPEPQNDPWAAFVRVDPDGALKVKKARFEAVSEEIDLIGKLASGVYDQASYDNALQRAGAHGLNTANLPREYSPELIQRFRTEAASAGERLRAIVTDRRLSWDIEDDQLDNGRADQLAASTLEDRTERQRITRQRVMDARERAKQASDDRRRGQDMAPRGGKGRVTPTGRTATNPAGVRLRELSDGRWVQ